MRVLRKHNGVNASELHILSVSTRRVRVTDSSFRFYTFEISVPVFHIAYRSSYVVRNDVDIKTKRILVVTTYPSYYLYRLAASRSSSQFPDLDFERLLSARVPCSVWHSNPISWTSESSTHNTRMIQCIRVFYDRSHSLKTRRDSVIWIFESYDLKSVNHQNKDRTAYLQLHVSRFSIWCG